MTKKDNKDLLIDTFSVKFSMTEDKNGKSVGKGVFARAGVPTANRRVYPESVWRKNINALMRDMKERKTYGELDHPCILTDDFRVFTSEGWKQFKEIKQGDKVWSRKDGKAVLSIVDEIIDEIYEGAAYQIKGRNIDVGLSPNHRVLLCNRKKAEEEYFQIKDLYNSSYYRHYCIPKTATWELEKTDFFVIPGLKDGYYPNKAKNDISEDLMLDAKLFAAFLGIYLSEGICTSDKVDNYDIQICQKNEWSRKLIHDEILSKFPKELEWREKDTGFILADARLYTWLKKLGNSYTKYIPNEVKNLDSECLRELLFWFTIGDGRLVGSNADKNITEDENKTFKEENFNKIRNGENIKNTRQDVFSVSEKLITDLHECLIKTGGCGSLSKIITEKDYVFAGRIIKAEDKVPLYQLHIGNSKNIWFDDRFLKIEKIEHKGNIYCLAVTHGNFYMEHKGKSFWTGNSDGKTKLQRVSHLMTDLKVESDGNIIGEMEIIPGTPNGSILQALVDANCTIGVSSRGYGSVKMNESGHDVVQDDYVLMTFDAVSDPANATSWPEFSKEGEAEESKQVDNKNVLTEVENKEEKPMTEQEQKSPKDAYKDMPVVPSPDPYGAVEAPKKYFGIFQKTDKEEYDFSVPKFIFTNKEDADEMAKKLTNDSETKDKSVFTTKEIELSNILRKEDKIVESEEYLETKEVISYNLELLRELKSQLKNSSVLKVKDSNYTAQGIEIEFIFKEPGGEVRRYIANIKKKKYEVTPNLPESEEPIIPEDLSTEIQNESKKLKEIISELQEDNEKLTLAAKEMAYRYFLEKNLSYHPKYQEIVAGLGKLTKYESVEELRSLIKVHMDEANEFVKIKQIEFQQKLQRLENDFIMKSEEFDKIISSQEIIVESKEKEIKLMREEISRLQSSLKEEQARIYLEQKLQGNPNAFAIRKAVTESGIIEKRIVDKMVESMTQPVELVTESTTFKQVRDSIARKQKLPNNTLVESSVKGTTASDVKRLAEDTVNPLINQSMQEFRILAGLENK